MAIHLNSDKLVKHFCCYHIVNGTKRLVHKIWVNLLHVLEEIFYTGYIFWGTFCVWSTAVTFSGDVATCCVGSVSVSYILRHGYTFGYDVPKNITTCSMWLHYVVRIRWLHFVVWLHLWL